jgi:hypothetical protein
VYGGHFAENPYHQGKGGAGDDDCPAFVPLGSHSLISVSGRDYQPSKEKVGLNNLVTVDLSPRSGSDWVDCARSFYVEDGVCLTVLLDDEFTRGYPPTPSIDRPLLAGSGRL